MQLYITFYEIKTSVHLLLSQIMTPEARKIYNKNSCKLLKKGNKFQ